MIVIDIIYPTTIQSPMINYAPFVYTAQPGVHDTATYWKSVFGAPDESTAASVTIASVIIDRNETYFRYDNLQNCLDNEGSFFWDVINELLYIHFDHDLDPLLATIQYGFSVGVTDSEDLYIDNVFYMGLVSNLPSFSKQQDLANYDKLSFPSGSIELSNNDSVIDSIINNNIYGNELRVYTLDYIQDQDNYTFSDLTVRGSYSVEDYNFILSKLEILFRDKRKSQNIKIPTEVFTLDEYPDIDSKYINKTIPLAYGLIYRSDALPTDTSGYTTTTYRQAQELTSLGTVEVKDGDEWNEVTPIAIDLPMGEFTLSEVDSRQTSGKPRKCRVTGSIGIIITRSSDIIKNLNYRYLNIDFISSTYDVDEWEAEEVQLEEIGILYNKEVELFEAIRMVQSGSNVGFRYDINADGRRTIRIDDWDRTVSAYVSRENIFNSQELSVKSDSELLAARAVVEYAYDYSEKEHSIIIDESLQETVYRAYNQKPSKDLESYLLTSAQAEALAAWYLARYKNIPRIASLDLCGPDYAERRIFDTIYAEITPGMADAGTGQVIAGREYFGIWKIQILSVDPNYTDGINKVTGVLIERYPSVSVVRISKAGVVRISRHGVKRAVE